MKQYYAEYNPADDEWDVFDPWGALVCTLSDPIQVEGLLSHLNR